MNPSPSTFNSATNSANSAPQSAAVVGCATGPQPRIAANWSAHDFGRVLKTTLPVTKDLVITSVGSAPLSGISVTASGDGFTIVGAAAGSLPPGNTTTVTVQFNPATYGKKTGSIRITSNAVNQNPVNITVKGKIYSTVTFIVQEETTNKKIAGVKLKVKQAGRKEKEATTNDAGKAVVETEHDGNFEVKLADCDTLLEFRSLASA